MKAEEYHSSLRPLEEACRLAQSDWLCVRNPLVGWSREGSILWKARVMLRHVALVARCWGAARHRQILVREFSTIPLLLVFPFLWSLRKKTFFLMHHNLQWADRRPAERFALAMLARLGAQWALFETQDLPDLRLFRIPSALNLVLPHPVSLPMPRQDSAPRRPLIGVVGYYRPEKGMEDLLRLLAESFVDCEVVAGVPNPEALSHLSIRVVDTSSDEAYRRLLGRCDVLVQNGAEESYFYRASGPIADAASCRTAVVAPDFPVISHQLTSPVPVGEVFSTLGDGLESLRRAVEKSRAGQYDFETYCAARSARSLAERLDDFSREQNGTS